MLFPLLMDLVRTEFSGWRNVAILLMIFRHVFLCVVSISFLHDAICHDRPHTSRTLPECRHTTINANFHYTQRTRGHHQMMYFYCIQFWCTLSPFLRETTPKLPEAVEGAVPARTHKHKNIEECTNSSSKLSGAEYCRNDLSA